MLAVEHVEQCEDVEATGSSERPLLRASDPALQEDAVLDGWIASLTPDQFERVLTSRALGRPRW